MSTYVVEASYHTGSHGRATLPEGKTWGDVDDWYVKWDCLHIRFKSQPEWIELSLNSDSSDSTDWKRPTDVSVYSVDEDGDVDYASVVAEV